jgi:hypothetical protein
MFIRNTSLLRRSYIMVFLPEMQVFGSVAVVIQIGSIVTSGLAKWTG